MKKIIIDRKVIKNIFTKIGAYIESNVLLLTFVLTSVINAVILRSITVHNTFYIKPLIADLAVVLFIASFAYFIKPKYRILYFLFFAIVLDAICIINAIYFKNYYSFSSISLLGTLGELGDYGNAVTENILEAKDFVYLWNLFVLIVMHFGLKRVGHFDSVEKNEVSKIRFLNTIIVNLIILGFFISMLSTKDISRLKKQWYREYVVMEFGIYTYQINDVYSAVKTKLNSMFGYDEAAKEFREYYADKPDEHLPNAYTNVFAGKNVLVIHAESIQNFLISDDFRGGKPATFNGEEVTPNLNRLAHEGIYFSNFYAQESAGTSSDTEFTFNTSLMPATSGTVFINYFNREYVTTPKLLKELGYYTFSMHGNKGSAWNRDRMHPSLGYDKFYNRNNAYEIDEEIGLGLSDKSFFKQSVEIIKDIDKENEKWYGLLIMLTNHTPFSDINNYEEESGEYFDVDYKYEVTNEDGTVEEKSAPYMDGTKLGNYIKSAHYADEAIGDLIEEMDEAGLLENTIIVIYGDHDNKLKKSEYNRYYNYDYEEEEIRDSDDPNYINVDGYFYEINRSVPFIIWSKDLANPESPTHELAGEVTTVMGMIDCLPTLGNMLGFESKYALGHDIFSVEENVVVFPTSNWMTNKIYYNSAKGSFRQLNLDKKLAPDDDEEPIVPDNTSDIIGKDDIPEDYIEYYNNYAAQIIGMSNNIIVYDLIKRVGSELDAENEELDLDQSIVTN